MAFSAVSVIPPATFGVVGEGVLPCAVKTSSISLGSVEPSTGPYLYFLIHCSPSLGNILGIALVCALIARAAAPGNKLVSAGAALSAPSPTPAVAAPRRN